MDVNYTIEVYSDKHKQEVLNLFKLNTPQYFSPEEEKDLNYYLENEIEYYFVLKLHGEILGSGGINITNDGTAKISWDFIHPNYHSKALGSRLLEYRINFIKQLPQIKSIIVRTSQLAYKFYEKNGFILTETKKDYWAPGFDLYTMKYK